VKRTASPDTSPLIAIANAWADLPCMFVLDAPFSSIQTRREYRPIEMSVQPIPGAYVIRVVPNSAPDISAKQLKRQFRVILQAGREWRFND
jgi:hypothetical protein